MLASIIFGIYEPQGLANKLFNYFSKFPNETIKVDGVSVSYSKLNGGLNKHMVVITAKDISGEIIASGRLYEGSSSVNGSVDIWGVSKHPRVFN